MVRTRRHNGFTLVELAVVLVVIALVVGGILVGRDLVRKSEMKSILADVQTIQSAISAFKTKYAYLPGDLPKATSYWGADATCPTTLVSDATPEQVTCDGNGNNKLDSPGWADCATGAAGYQQESYRMWQHLSDAGLFPGMYTGINGGGSIRHGIVGENIPQATKVSKIGYQITNFANDMPAGGGGHQGDWFQYNFGNVLFIGRQDTVAGCFEPNQPFLSPPEAQQFDSKVDDGKPATGNLLSYTIAKSPLCVDSNSGFYETINYAANDDKTACALILKIQWW